MDRAAVALSADVHPRVCPTLPSQRAVVSTLLLRLMPILVVPLALFLIVRFNQPMSVVISFQPADVLFVIALVFHAELADDRPSPAHLTGALSLDGGRRTLGGLFKRWWPPAVFVGIAEYPWSSRCHAWWFRPRCASPTTAFRRHDALAPAASRGLARVGSVLLSNGLDRTAAGC